MKLNVNRKINFFCVLITLLYINGCSPSSSSSRAASIKKGGEDALAGVKDENLYRKDKGYQAGYDHAQTHIPKK